MKGADVFAQHVEIGCDQDKYEVFEVINRVVNPEGELRWAIEKPPITKQFGNDFELIYVLTEGEYLAAQKELGWKLKKFRRVVYTNSLTICTGC
tara:strand:+ start:234 stop:515 length:282 start_codon:yes stop_codon:yes gene_type:complete